MLSPLNAGLRLAGVLGDLGSLIIKVTISSVKDFGLPMTLEVYGKAERWGETMRQSEVNTQDSFLFSPCCGFTCSCVSIGYLPSVVLFTLWDRLSRWTSSSPIWLGWLACELQESTYFAFLVLELQGCMWLYLAFYLSAGDLNSGPPSCIVNTLPNELSPQVSEYILKICFFLWHVTLRHVLCHWATPKACEYVLVSWLQEMPQCDSMWSHRKVSNRVYYC